MLFPLPRSLSAVVLSLVATAGARAHAADVVEADPSAPTEGPAAASTALEITGVESGQACDGEWTAELGPAGDGAYVALLGTDQEWTIDVKPDGLTESRLSNCTLNVAVRAAPGVSYAISKVSYEGRAALDEGVVAEQSVAYNFVGGPPSTRVVHHTEGPYEGTVSMDQPFPEDRLLWSSCDDPKPLQLRASLYLHNTDPQRNGWLSMALNAGIQLVVVDIVTRPCPAAPAAESPSLAE